LAPGYPGIGQGYDMMVVNALGLKADAVKKYITEKAVDPSGEQQ